MKKPIEQALENIQEAEQQCKKLVEKGSYTGHEMQKLRTLLLRTVRNDLDPYLGHMPDKRYY